MTPRDLQLWRRKLNLSLDEAAAALGHKPSSLKAMLYGFRPINATTALLAAAVEKIAKLEGRLIEANYPAPTGGGTVLAPGGEPGEVEPPAGTARHRR